VVVNTAEVGVWMSAMVANCFKVELLLSLLHVNVSGGEPREVHDNKRELPILTLLLVTGSSNGAPKEKERSN